MTRSSMLRPYVESQALVDLGPWYHDFTSLGVRVPQRPEPFYAINQRCKEGPILALLQLALEKARRTSADRPSVLELFCADGYYAAHARRMGAGEVLGVDLDASSLARANAMFAFLCGERDRFIAADVLSFVPASAFDVVVCCGGLYHLADPAALLARCRAALGRRYLVVQTVVSEATDDEGYFVTPAPEWQHGSRFSASWVRAALRRCGWHPVVEHVNILEGNTRPVDRGSFYALCEPA